MDTHSISDKINALQRELDTGGYTYNGIHSWPVIRLGIYLSSKKSVDHDKVSLVSRLKFLGLGLIEGARFLFGGFPKAGVFFLSSSHYKTVENGKRYDRIIAPFLDWMEKHGKDYTVAEFTNQYRYTNDLAYQANVVKVQPVIYLLSFYWRILFRFARPALKGDLKRFHTVAARYAIGFRLDRSFAWRMYLLERQSRFFERLLKRAGTTHVLTVCYYDFKSLALMLAANRLGLRAMDLQHGVQGPSHMAYATWTDHTGQRSGFLPTYFWTWDEFSRDTIAAWKPEKEAILLGCNRWFADRVDHTQGDIILFTVQPIDNSIPKELIDAIRAYQGNKKWYIRLHPYQQKELPYFRAMLEAAEVGDKVNLEDATRLPLTELLKRTHLHITFFSSVAIEASYFNIPTLFMDDRGKEFFKESLPGHLARFIRDGSSLGECIRALEQETIGLNRQAVQHLRDRFSVIENFFV